MAPRKLSDSDKGEIIDLYKQPGQTTTTLAEQFDVSNSTISRILKSSIPPDEYSELISQKRMAGSDKAEPEKKKPVAKKTRSRAAKKSTQIEPSAGDDPPQLEAELSEEAAQFEMPKLKSNQKETEREEADSGKRRRRRRSQANQDNDEQLPLLSTKDEAEADEPRKPVAAPVLTSTEADDDDDDDDDDDLVGLDETLGDDFGDDDDDLDDDDDDEEDIEVSKPKLQAEQAMEIMPLGEAVMPKPCYLVVDMRAELITRPLSEFADLGQVPSAEEQSKTLPVFDNHRVARRFSRNKQRVIKVPDGNLITRTSPYLQAKGITRLLVDGQVFDLG